MGRGTDKRNEECMRCKDCKDYGGTGDDAVFCTGCGRQLKAIPEGRFESRSAECSEQTARRVFGFEDAYSSKRTPGAMDGSIRSAATQAVVAIQRSIAKDFATSTPDEARVMDAESVAEGVEWDLSTEQLQAKGRLSEEAVRSTYLSFPNAKSFVLLRITFSLRNHTRQVMALTRSCALRGRRRRRHRLRSQAQRVALSAAKLATKRVSGAGFARWSPTRNGRPERCAPNASCSFGRVASCVLYPSSERKHGQSRDGTRQPTKKGARNKEDSDRKRSTLHASRPRFATPNKTPSTLIGESTKLLRGRAAETKEQAIAMARGGIRYRRMVFQRKGVKLTEDSPRSMRPREVFRKRGLHPLCSRGFFVAGNSAGVGQIFVATVSAVVRTTDAKTVGDHGEADALRLDMRRLHRCAGLRLEVCAKGPLDNLHDIKHINAFEAPLLLTSATRIRGAIHTFFLSNGSARDATENIATILLDNEADGGGSDDQSMVGRGRIRDCAGQERLLALGRRLPHALPAILSPRHLKSGEASDPAMCPSTDAIFVEDLSHEEIGALVGRDIVWRDPFEEDRTIDELEDTWVACLKALRRRLRFLTPEAHDPDRLSDTKAGGLYSEALTTERATGVSSLHNAQGFSDKVPTNHSTPNAATFLPKRSGERDPLLSAAADMDVSAGPVGEKHLPGSLSIDEVDVGGQYGPADHAKGRKDHGFLARVSFNKTLVRVGARVPWGRRKGGRFAKVLFTVSVGKACRGLDFVAVNVSSTSDPMLRGRWECHVTDRDLARFLRTGCGEGTGSNLRRCVPAYESKRCAAQLQKSGDLECVCSMLAKRAFSLVLIVPGGVSLSFAGLTEHVGREIAWPQDIEEDRTLREASVDVQRTWRGWSSRRRTLWVRMEREGRQRLARLQEKIQHEWALEADAQARAERRMRAQIVLAAAARGRMARLEATRKRMEYAQEPSQDDPNVDVCGPAVEETSMQIQVVGSCNQPQEVVTADDGDGALNDAQLSPVPEWGFARFERDVSIDGTEVHLIVDVKEVESGRDVWVEEMVFVAVDKKTRRSSALSLAAADIRHIVGPADGPDSASGVASGGGWVSDAGTYGVFTAVLKRLTVFKNRRKDLFILSYRGRRS